MADPAPPWLVKAASYLGFHEVGVNRGIEHFIDDAHTGQLGDPWCAIFVNACLEESGVPGTRSAAARSFEHSANFVELHEPALGCIVTRWRGSPSGGLGHVFFYCGENSNGIVAIAGNENDAVRRYYEGKSTIVGYWWPHGVALPTGGRLTLPVATALGHADWEAGATSPSTGPAANLLTPNPSPPRPTQVGRVFHVTGKAGTFGGPRDTGMKTTEGLAIWTSRAQMEAHDAGDLLGPDQGMALGRSLDPDKYYLACRWDYTETPINILRDSPALVSANGKSLLMRPVDWGPNVRTGRVVDLSPGGARYLGVDTDNQLVTVTFPAPELKPAPIQTDTTPPAAEPSSMPTKPQVPATQIDPNQLAQALLAAMRMAKQIDDAIPVEQKKSMFAALVPILGSIFTAAGASQLGIWGTIGSLLFANGVPALTSQNVLITAAGAMASGLVQMLNRVTQPPPPAPPVDGKMT